MTEPTYGWPEPPYPHDGEYGQRCGRVYDNVYRVPDDVWAKIAPSPVDGWKAGGLLCPPCAERRAHEAGINLWWEAAVDDFPTAVAQERVASA